MLGAIIKAELILFKMLYLLLIGTCTQMHGGRGRKFLLAGGGGEPGGRVGWGCNFFVGRGAMVLRKCFKKFNGKNAKENYFFWEGGLLQD